MAKEVTEREYAGYLMEKTESIIQKARHTINRLDESDRNIRSCIGRLEDSDRDLYRIY